MFNKKKQICYTIAMGFMVFLLIFYPKGATLNSETNWRPLWSLEFFLLVLIYITIFIIFPLIYLQVRIYRSFQSAFFKIRWRRFTVGSTMSGILSYGAFLYVFWDNMIYRTIWSGLSLFIIVAAIFIYLGVAQEIQRTPQEACPV